MNNFKVYFNTKMKVIPPTMDENVNNLQVVATMTKNLEQYGYLLEEDLINSLSHCSVEDIDNIYKQLVEIIKENVGYLIKNVKPLFPNFPNDLLEEKVVDKYVETINGYTKEFEKFNFLSEVKKKYPLMTNLPKKIIRLGSEEDYKQYYVNLLSAKSSISSADSYNLSNYIKEITDEELKDLLPDTITSKEVLALVANTIVENHKDSVSILYKYFSTATDVLRFVVAISNGDISLSQPTKFIKFNRPQRRFIMELLNNCNKYTLVEDMKRYKNQWIKLGEIVHPGEFKKYKDVVKAFNTLRNSKKIETFNSKVEAAFNNKDAVTLVNLLSKRPGEFARRLGRIVRTFPDNTSILYAFGAVANKVSTQVLLQTKEYFKYADEENSSEFRVFFPKGGTTKAYGVENKLTSVNKDICDLIISICDNALIEVYKDREEMGKVYIDPEMVNFVVPMSQRSASKSLLSVAKGSRFTIQPDTKFIRTFMYWREPKDNTTDLDLSAVMMDENLVHISDVSFYNLREDGCTHSGDVRQAPEGASEYIDIDIDRLLNKGVRYIAIMVNSYSSQNLCDLPECFCGFMERNSLKSDELYDPVTVVNKSDISIKATQSMPFIIDLESMQVIWVDMHISDVTFSSSTVAANRNPILLTVKSILSCNKPNIYDLMELNVKARGELVDTPDEADIIVSMNGNITPYSTDEIIANYI